MLCGQRYWDRKLGSNGIDIQAVPVRPRPRMRTFMGTTRPSLRRLMSVSLVKMSVRGREVYLEEYAILNAVYYAVSVNIMYYKRVLLYDKEQYVITKGACQTIKERQLKDECLMNEQRVICPIS